MVFNLETKHIHNRKYFLVAMYEENMTSLKKIHINDNLLDGHLWLGYPIICVLVVTRGWTHLHIVFSTFLVDYV